jgi:RNA polymerase sigma-70 factor (ECF subfamily)
VIDVTPELLSLALARDPIAVRRLVSALTPIIQARVARALLRLRSTRRQNRNPAEEVRDMTQEVFASLFADDAKALRAWQPSRGLSLVNFVGLIAEHQVASIFRSGRRRPWSEEIVVDNDFDSHDDEASGPEQSVATAQLYGLLLDRMRAELTPRGFELFQMLFLDEKPVEAVCAAMGMTADSVYQWRSRLPKLVRKVHSAIEAEHASLEAPPRASADAKAKGAAL